MAVVAPGVEEIQPATLHTINFPGLIITDLFKEWVHAASSFHLLLLYCERFGRVTVMLLMQT
jgi:hypothetical protein